MKNNLPLLPFVCVCDTYETPNLGIFGQAKIVKYRELTVPELIKFGFINSMEDLRERGLPKWFLVYSGKRPSLKRVKSLTYFEQYDYEA